MSYQVEFEIKDFIKNHIVLTKQRIRTKPDFLEVDGFSITGSEEKVQRLMNILQEVQAKQLRFKFSEVVNYKVFQRSSISFPNVKTELPSVYTDQLQIEDLQVWNITDSESLQLWPLTKAQDGLYKLLEEKQKELRLKSKQLTLVKTKLKNWIKLVSKEKAE